MDARHACNELGERCDGETHPDPIDAGHDGLGGVGGLFKRFEQGHCELTGRVKVINGEYSGGHGSKKQGFDRAAAWDLAENLASAAFIVPESAFLATDTKDYCKNLPITFGAPITPGLATPTAA